MAQKNIEQRLADLVATVEADPDYFALLSPGEQIAVAAVLSRLDLLLAAGVKDLASVKDRLGPDWWAGVRAIQRARQ